MKINEPICACPSVVLIKWIIDLLQRELINKYIKEEGCLQHEKNYYYQDLLQRQFLV
ncbi:hypothetical protein ACT7C9_08105 [Bacillus cereus]